MAPLPPVTWIGGGDEAMVRVYNLQMGHGDSLRWGMTLESILQRGIEGLPCHLPIWPHSGHESECEDETKPVRQHHPCLFLPLLTRVPFGVKADGLYRALLGEWENWRGRDRMTTLSSPQTHSPTLHPIRHTCNEHPEMVAALFR